MGNAFSSLLSKTDPGPKVILITGASSGIGKATAKTLIQRGHVVYGAARRIDKMQDLVEEGGHALELDVTKTADIEKAIAQILKEQSRIDVLVNSAGAHVMGAIEDVPMDYVREHFEVNFFGTCNITKQVLPHMRKQGGGTIVNVSSIAGKIYGPFASYYAASKHALEGWSDCLRVEVAPFKIKVAIIEPGYVKTPVMKVGTLLTPTESPYSKGVKDAREDAKFLLEEKGTDPYEIADVITQACESSTPRRRYVAGLLAVPLLFMRTFIGDWFMDYWISNMNRMQLAEE